MVKQVNDILNSYIWATLYGGDGDDILNIYNSGNVLIMAVMEMMFLTLYSSNNSNVWRRWG